MKKLLLSISLVLLCVVAHGQVDSSAIILRGDPYLQNPTDGGITVCWQTALPCHSYVEWGEDTTKLDRAHTLVAGQVIANNTLNKIRINGLQSGQTYYYRIISRHITSYGAYKKTFGGTYRSPFYSFTSPSDKTSEFEALIFNDLHQHTATIDTLMTMVRAKGLKYDFVLFNGDCVDDPKDENQAVTTINHFNRAVGSTDKPVIYMRGNHEIRNAYSMQLTDLFDYTGGQSFGAMSWGDTRIVMLDCGEDKPDEHWVYYGLNDFSGFRAEQLKFLENEHKNADFRKAKKRILIHHIPLWAEDMKKEYNPSLELWGEELAAQPYNVAINAHTHRAVMHPKGSLGNPFPVLVGGGPSIKDATVIHLVKKGDKLTATAYNPAAEVVWQGNF